jgi:hypothetical protein
VVDIGRGRNMGVRGFMRGFWGAVGEWSGRLGVLLRDLGWRMGRGDIERERERCGLGLGGGDGGNFVDGRWFLFSIWVHFSLELDALFGVGDNLVRLDFLN